MLNEKIPPSSRSVKILEINLKGVPDIENSGCRPYIQVFKNASLLYSSKQKGEELKAYRCDSDSKIHFPMELDLEGDVLIRVRHETSKAKRITMLRLAFHTGYLDRKAIITFKRSQLDGAWNSENFPKDFVLEMRARFSTEPAPDQAQSEEFWRMVNARHDRSQFMQIENKVFNILDDQDDDDDTDSDEEEIQEEEKKKREELRDELVQQSDLLGLDSMNKKSEEKDNEFADLEKYVAGLEMDDDDDSDVDPNMAAMFDKLADVDDDAGSESDEKLPAPEQADLLELP